LLFWKESSEKDDSTEGDLKFREEKRKALFILSFLGEGYLKGRKIRVGGDKL